MQEEDWACTLQTLILRSENRNQTGLFYTERLGPTSGRCENAQAPSPACRGISGDDACCIDHAEGASGPSGRCTLRTPGEKCDLDCTATN
jgi:hypothetical protein